MWQRFTERARRVVFFAQEEAGQHGENYVSTEHLLLGLCRENDSVAARILERLGVSLQRIRDEIERQIPRGDGRLGQDMQLTPRAKRVVDLAYDEARILNNNYIGTEHVLLGLIREGEGLAGRVLTKLGVDLERTRREVILLQTAEPATGDQARTAAPGPAASTPDEILQQIADRAVGESAPSATVEDLRRRIERLAGIENVGQRTGGDSAPTAAGVQPGDLGKIVAANGRDHAEVALDAAAFLRLVDIFAATDAHGYRAMTQGDQTVFLIPVGTPLKVLVTPPETDPTTPRYGRFVRVLSGFYAGYSGWVFRNAFEFTGKDENPFPPAAEGQQ